MKITDTMVKKTEAIVIDISKDITRYKAELTKVEKYNDSLAVTSQESYEAALKEGQEINHILKTITDRKEQITKPLNAALKSARELFKPLEERAEIAIQIIKNKMLAWTHEETRKAEEAKQKLAARVDKGTMRADTAVRKMDEIIAPEKTVVIESGSATTVVRKAYRVVDKTKIPLEFMEPDMVRIKQEFRAGRPVDGVEEYEETGMKFG